MGLSNGYVVCRESAFRDAFCAMMNCRGTFAVGLGRFVSAFLEVDYICCGILKF